MRQRLSTVLALGIGVFVTLFAAIFALLQMA